jgi:chromosome segregation ATPase
MPSVLREAYLQAEVDLAKAQLQRLGTDQDAWTAAIAARDEEIQNLQAAVGELAYSSEAAERLRTELRGSVRALKEAKQKLGELRQELADGAATKQALEREVDQIRQQLQKRDKVEARLSVSQFQLWPACLFLCSASLAKA